VLSLLREMRVPAYSAAEIKRREKVEKARLEEEKRERIRAEKASLEQQKLEKIKAEKAKLENERLEKERIKKANFAKARMQSSDFGKTKFEYEKKEDAPPESTQTKSESTPQTKAESAQAGSTRFELVRSDLAQRETQPPEEIAEQNPRSKRLVIAAILVVACVAGLFFLSRRGFFHSSISGSKDRLMVTAVENRTGDKTLDGAVAQGLQFALQESPMLAFRGSDAYRWVARRLVGSADRPVNAVLARQAAQAAGAKAYLYGTIQQSGAEYTLTLDVLKAANNHKLVEVQEVAANREQIASAIDRAAVRLRAALGEKGESLAHTQVPLNLEATANLEALRQYSIGEAAEVDGRTDDALAAFQSAATLDPKFIQAQMRLSWLDRRQHAEADSAAAAQLAEQAAESASERTQLLANYADEVNAMGDLTQAEVAIRRFVVLYPNDAEGQLSLARVLRLQGRAGEALDAAQRGIAEDSYNAELYAQAELALIDLDRYDDALSMEQKAAQLATAHAGIALTTAYLADQQGQLSTSIEQVEQPPRSAASMAAYGLYLDNTGQIAAGTTLWRSMAAGIGSSSVSAASGPWMLAQGALDRGLMGDCESAQEMAQTALSSAKKQSAQELAMTTEFNAGIAAALCGEGALAQGAIATLGHDRPDSAAVAGYELPDLRAAVALGRHDPQAALDALKSAQSNNAALLTVYLRGLAYVGLRQTQLGIEQFQAVLGHRGLALTGGSNVYPVAQSALARVYAQSGDQNNSAQEYKIFLESWSGADPAERLKVEADAAITR
jgi:serine/threonine-protein kinase